MLQLQKISCVDIKGMKSIFLIFFTWVKATGTVLNIKERTLEDLNQKTTRTDASEAEDEITPNRNDSGGD